jgi:hypothetical protein
MFVQLGLAVISGEHRKRYRKNGKVKVGQEIVTLEKKLAALTDSIAWAEEQVAQTYLWIEEHGHCFAKPSDWQVVIAELRADLAVMQGIQAERLTVAA